MTATFIPVYYGPMDGSAVPHEWLRSDGRLVRDVSMKTYRAMDKAFAYWDWSHGQGDLTLIYASDGDRLVFESLEVSK